MGMLTVRENIHFSASLRLPKTMSREHRDQRVNQILEDLSLTNCADTKVKSLYESCCFINFKWVLSTENLAILNQRPWYEELFRLILME